MHNSIHAKPKLLSLISGRTFVRAGQAWLKHECSRFGAAIAFYTIFSLAPILVIATAIAGSIFGRDAVQGRVVNEIQHLVGSDAAHLLQQMILNAYQSQGSALATGLSTLALLFGASAVFAELRQIFERIWGIHAQSNNAIIGFLLLRLRGMLLVIAIGCLLLLSLIANAIFVWLRDQLAFFDQATAQIASLIKLPLSLVFTTGLFMLMMAALLPERVQTRLLAVGALLSAILFELGKVAINFYLSQAAIASSFGAAGSLAVLLVWIFYVALILLFGAEFMAAVHQAELHQDENASAG